MFKNSRNTQGFYVMFYSEFGQVSRFCVFGDDLFHLDIFIFHSRTECFKPYSAVLIYVYGIRIAYLKSEDTVHENEKVVSDISYREMVNLTGRKSKSLVFATNL